MSSSKLKITFTLLSFFLMGTILTAQVPLKPLFEEFTSSTCGPCAFVNEVIDPILHANAETHSLIKHQVDWPGDGDPYYIPQNSVRVNYYGVTGVPNLFANSNFVNSPQNMTQSSYESYLNETTFMEIDITNAEIDEDNMVHVSVDLTTGAYYDNGLKAHIVLIEKKTVNNVESNGEIEFFNVVMQMLPDAQGTTLPAINEGETVTLTQSYDMNSTFMEAPNDLAVVVFVQDDSDKSIIQSENRDIEGQFETYNITFDVKDSNGEIVEGANIFLDNLGSANTDVSGLFTYNGVFSGDINYSVTFPGLLDVIGTANLVDQDITINVEMEVPDYFVYEDFAVEGNDWSPTFSGSDAVYWWGGKWIFFRQSGTLNPLYLVSPPFDIAGNGGGVITFSLGGINGAPIAGFGTITDPMDPSTQTELTTYIPAAEYQDFEYNLFDLANSSDELQFYWNHQTSDFSWYEMEYVLITVGEPSSVETQILKEVKVSPNPASDFVNVHLDMMIDEILVYDSTGKLVEQNTVNANDFQLNTSRYHSGLYSVLIRSSKGQVMKMIVVEN